MKIDGFDIDVGVEGETVFLWIGPLFHRIGPRVSQDRTFSKTNAPIPKKHPVCQEHRARDCQDIKEFRRVS